MISVSDAWKAIHEETIVPESFVEVTYWITDPGAQGSAVESNNGALPYSDHSEILETDIKQFEKYATLENNMWVLDATYDILPDEAPYGNTGYVADAEYPMVTITFPEVRYQLVPGLTIVWSEAYREYATRCRITALNGTEVVVSEEFLNNSIYSTFELPMSEYDRIYIEIIDWLVPDHRPRIERVYVGVREVYTKSELLSFSHSQSVDLLSSELPKNEIVFSLDNSSGLWNPDDPAGMARYLIDRQEISVRYGYMVSSNIEWIPAGTFWLSEWNTPSNGLAVTFTARDILEFLDARYSGSRKGTLYQIATWALSQVNLPKTESGSIRYSLDESLKDISTDFSEDNTDYTVAVVLQMVANAGQCVMYQDRNGILRIEKHNKTRSDYEINRNISYTHPERTLTKPPYSVAVNGDMWSVTQMSPSGEAIEISNPIITQTQNAALVGSWAAGILQNRNLIHGSYRPDPRLDALDIVTVESKYSRSLTVAVTEIRYEYNGAFRGEYVGREIEV